MDIREILSDNIIVFLLGMISGTIDFGVLLPILGAGMYTGNSKLLLFINPFLWLLFFIFLIAPIIAYLKDAGRL